jgi:hypothetical protein
MVLPELTSVPTAYSRVGVISSRRQAESGFTSEGELHARAGHYTSVPPGVNWVALAEPRERQSTRGQIVSAARRRSRAVAEVARTGRAGPPHRVSCANAAVSRNREWRRQNTGLGGPATGACVRAVVEVQDGRRRSAVGLGRGRQDRSISGGRSLALSSVRAQSANPE